ncbi:hypothetical protein PO909_016964 [Leuciscus waleckii]
MAALSNAHNRLKCIIYKKEVYPCRTECELAIRDYRQMLLFSSGRSEILQNMIVGISVTIPEASFSRPMERRSHRKPTVLQTSKLWRQLTVTFLPLVWKLAVLRPKRPERRGSPFLHHLYFTSIKSGTGQISDEEQMSTIPNEPLWKQDIPEPSAQWAVKSHIKKKPIGGRCGISAAYQIQLPDYFDTSVGASER